MTRQIVHVRWPDDAPQNVEVAAYPADELDLRDVAERTLRRCAGFGHIVMTGPVTCPLGGSFYRDPVRLEYAVLTELEGGQTMLWRDVFTFTKDTWPDDRSAAPERPGSPKTGDPS